VSAGPAEQLRVRSDIVQQFDLTSLAPIVQACAPLAGDAPVDVAVLGQFKSGKSSLLNAVLGESMFPVGVLPLTAVITRAAAGPDRLVRVTYRNESLEEVAPKRLGEFVTEAGNPGNRQQVAVVDVFTPTLRDWPGLRLVDAPGLGSVFLHNTEATRTWMPNVAVALVTVSAERPLSDEDRRLVAEAQQTAPRVVVVLTKVDLLTEAERKEVIAFLERALHDIVGATVLVLPFSARGEPQRWVDQLREAVLRPVAGNIAGERQAALMLKLTAVARACHGYLTIGLQAAERSDAERDQFRSAVFDESDLHFCCRANAYFPGALVKEYGACTKLSTPRFGLVPAYLSSRTQPQDGNTDRDLIRSGVEMAFPSSTNSQIQRRHNLVMPAHSRRLRVAALELAVLAPLLALLFVMTIDFARIFSYQFVLNNCARNGGFFGSNLRSYQETGEVQPYDDIVGVTMADGTVLNSPLTASQVTTATGTGSDGNPNVTVNINYPFTLVTNFPGIPNTFNLTA
jgi:GTP-binding protein EngB required for normal cell division